MNTYTMCKALITMGNYSKDDMLNKLDVFLLSDRIKEEQYKELVTMMN